MPQNLLSMDLAYDGFIDIKWPKRRMLQNKIGADFTSISKTKFALCNFPKKCQLNFGINLRSKTFCSLIEWKWNQNMLAFSTVTTNCAQKLEITCY